MNLSCNSLIRLTDDGIAQVGSEISNNLQKLTYLKLNWN